MKDQLQFAIVCPAYRCEQWVARSLRSIQEQTHTRFRCVLIDDVSPDSTFETARAVVAGDGRFVVLRNERRQYPLANLVKATALAGQASDDVVVVVDADDWLKDSRVLERLARVYEDPGAWLSYGSCELLRPPNWRARLRRAVLGTEFRGAAAPYPPFVCSRSLYRFHPGKFLATHLRSYRKFLWDSLRDEDLRDDDGNYFTAAADAVTMWPMMEMATDRHIRFIRDILYVYNNDHGLSENRQQASWFESDQYRVNLQVRARPPYAPLPERHEPLVPTTFTPE